MEEKVITYEDELTFRYGPGCKLLEQQANEQGYTLAESADHLQQLGNALSMLLANRILNNNQYGTALRRLHKQVMLSIRPKFSMF